MTNEQSKKVKRLAEMIIGACFSLLMKNGVCDLEAALALKLTCKML